MSTIAHAVKSLRENRALLKKRKFKDIKKLVHKESGTTELEFKQVSPEELDLIKTKIREEAKKAVWREIGVYVLCSIVVVSCLFWVFF